MIHFCDHGGSTSTTLHSHHQLVPHHRTLPLFPSSSSVLSDCTQPTWTSRSCRPQPSSSTLTTSITILHPHSIPFSPLRYPSDDRTTDTLSTPPAPMLAHPSFRPTRAALTPTSGPSTLPCHQMTGARRCLSCLMRSSRRSCDISNGTRSSTSGVLIKE